MLLPTLTTPSISTSAIISPLPDILNGPEPLLMTTYESMLPPTCEALFDDTFHYRLGQQDEYWPLRHLDEEAVVVDHDCVLEKPLEAPRVQPQGPVAVGQVL